MSEQKMNEEDLLGLSDDEILNMVSEPLLGPDETDEGNREDEGADEDEPADDGAGALSEEDGDEADDSDDDDAADAPGSADDGDEPDAVGDQDGEAGQDETGKDEGAGKERPAGDAKAKAKGDAEAGDTAKSDVAPIDYKAEYEKIMAPFKAAGKTIQLNSPEDVIQLMQMGAHYTKKMQALQPNLKLLRMLENNGLLDEGKLSFLIDVSRKNPGAIQKLIKDSGLDPLEIDSPDTPEYRPGNHRVSDAEIRFNTTLEEIVSDPEGKNLVFAIDKTWDTASKDALWDDPDILRVLTEQKANGIYDQIATEIERRRTLGYLRNEPFLKAYQTVGQEMQAQGVLTPRQANQQAPAQPGGQPAQERRVVDTRPAQRKTVSNSDRAKAASPTRTAPRKKPAADFNPLSLSDEEFEKNAELARKL